MIKWNNDNKNIASSFRNLIGAFGKVSYDRVFCFRISAIKIAQIYDNTIFPLILVL